MKGRARPQACGDTISCTIHESVRVGVSCLIQEEPGHTVKISSRINILAKDYLLSQPCWVAKKLPHRTVVYPLRRGGWQIRAELNFVYVYLPPGLIVWIGVVHESDLPLGRCDRGLKLGLHKLFWKLPGAVHISNIRLRDANHLGCSVIPIAEVGSAKAIPIVSHDTPMREGLRATHIDREEPGWAVPIGAVHIEIVRPLHFL
jgi:hypothetical protein